MLRIPIEISPKKNIGFCNCGVLLVAACSTSAQTPITEASFLSELSKLDQELQVCRGKTLCTFCAVVLKLRTMHQMEDSASRELPPSLIAAQFLGAFYKQLHDHPDTVHTFYGEDAQFCRLGQASSGDITATGQQVGLSCMNPPALSNRFDFFLPFCFKNIHERILHMNYDRCTVQCDYVDAQNSSDGSVVVMVTGRTGNKGQPRRLFVQTFVLARHEYDGQVSYYVSNDILRFTDQLPSAQPASSPAASPIPSGSPALPETSLRTTDSPRPAEAEVFYRSFFFSSNVGVDAELVCLNSFVCVVFVPYYLFIW